MYALIATGTLRAITSLKAPQKRPWPERPSQASGAAGYELAHSFSQRSYVLLIELLGVGHQFRIRRIDAVARFLDRIRVAAALRLHQLLESGQVRRLVLPHHLHIGDRLIQQSLDFRIVLGAKIDRSDDENLRQLAPSQAAVGRRGPGVSDLSPGRPQAARHSGRPRKP